MTGDVVIHPAAGLPAAYDADGQGWLPPLWLANTALALLAGRRSQMPDWPWHTNHPYDEPPEDIEVVDEDEDEDEYNRDRAIDELMMQEGLGEVIALMRAWSDRHFAVIEAEVNRAYRRWRRGVI
jgi:hypothetical protein